MSKHTAGPWSVDDNHGKRYIEPVWSNEPVAVVCKKKGDEFLANAHLIAAAPDLLEALEDMLSGWKYIRESHGDLYGVGWDRAQNKARAAIAKATGEAQ